MTLSDLFRYAGIRSKEGDRYNIRVHSIRKFFRTQLTTLGMPPDYVEYTMGISSAHTLGRI